MDPKSVESALTVLSVEVNDLPETAELWPEQPDSWRTGLMIEWDTLMSRLAKLHDLYQAGNMSPMHAQKYRKIARQLRDYLPIVNQLGWTMPSVSLDKDIAA